MSLHPNAASVRQTPFVQRIGLGCPTLPHSLGQLLAEFDCAKRDPYVDREALGLNLRLSSGYDEEIMISSFVQRREAWPFRPRVSARDLNFRPGHWVETAHPANQL
jgi:hypothetical protein